MALNDSLTSVEKSKLAVWDYPVSDKFTKVTKDVEVSNLLIDIIYSFGSTCKQQDYLIPLKKHYLE